MTSIAKELKYDADTNTAYATQRGVARLCGITHHAVQKRVATLQGEKQLEGTPVNGYTVATLEDNTLYFDGNAVTYHLMKTLTSAQADDQAKLTAMTNLNELVATGFTVWVKQQLGIVTSEAPVRLVYSEERYERYRDASKLLAAQVGLPAARVHNALTSGLFGLTAEEARRKRVKHPEAVGDEWGVDHYTEDELHTLTTAIRLVCGYRKGEWQDKVQRALAEFNVNNITA